MLWERKSESEKRTTEKTKNGKKAAGGSLLLRFSPTIVVRRSKVTSRRRRRRGKIRPRDNEKRMRMRETERTESDWRSAYVRTLCCPEDGGGESGFLFCASFGTWPCYSLIQFSLSISRSLPLSPLFLPPYPTTIQFRMLGTESFPIIPRFIASPTNLNGG